MSNVIRAVFSGGARSVVTTPQYMWSKGQILLIEGLDLPTAFRVYFSNKKKGKGVSKPVLGQYNVCLIPDEYFERAAAVNGDRQLYKQAGNSVTVNVIYEIAKHFKKDEDRLD